MTTLFDLPRPVPAPPPVTAAKPKPLVIGLDVALGTTGVAGPDWTDRIRTGDRRGEERLDYILDACQSFYRHADMVVLEGPSYGNALQVGHDEMSAIRWIIRCDLKRRSIPFAIVAPDSRTVYATGKARWKDEATGKKLTARQVKGLVRDAVAERYGIDCTGASKYDQADAFVLAAMGLHWRGYPLASVPTSHARALKSVHWPDLGAAA